MSQIQSVQTFTDGVPGGLNASRINSHVNDAYLLNGAVTGQPTKSAPASGDFVLCGRSGETNPYACLIDNLLLQTQKDGSLQYVASDTGSLNAYAVQLAIPLTALNVGHVLRFRAQNTNTLPCTVTVKGSAGNSVATLTIKNRAGSDLSANDILTGQIVTLVYDGTYFQLITAISAGEITATMLAESARNGTGQYAGTSSGTNTITASLPITPTTLTGLTLRFKAGGTNTGAATFNCGFGGAVTIKRIVAGALADLAANDIQTGDIVTLTHDGANYILSGRVRSWDYVGTAAATLANGIVTFDTQLGAVPTKLRVVLVAQGSTDAPWVANNELEIAGLMDSAGSAPRLSVWTNGAVVNVCLYDTGVRAISATATYKNLTAANWKIKIYASL